MPYVIPIIAYIVEAVLVYYGVATVVAYLVAVVVAVGLSKLMGGKSSNGDITASDPPQQILTRGTVNTDDIGYGQSKKSGTLMFIDVSGTNNDYLWQVIHLIGHEIDSIPSVYFDDDEIPSAHIDGSGNVISPNKYNGRAVVRRYLGTAGQLADSLMVTQFSGDGRWTSNDRARGNAILVIRLKRDDPTSNTETKVFPMGPPNTISAQMKLRKVYDPRLDTTAGGSGSHRANDPTTWQWSDNPALCSRDYLCLGNSVVPDGAGMAEDQTIVNVSELVAAANRCDVTISFPGSVSQKQYTCSGFLRTSATLGTNKEILETSMMGKVFYSGGQWHIFAGGYDTPTVTLSARDFAGDLSFDTTMEHSERFNEYRAIYQNAVELWRDQESTPIGDSGYQTDDGEYLPATLNLPLTTSEFTAQYISYMTLQQTRNMQRFVATMKPRAVQLRAWDTVLLDVAELGWSNKAFKIVQWKLGALGLPDLTFREEDPNRWNWTSTNAVARTFNTPTTPAVEVPPPPTSLIATPLPEVVNLKWSSPAFSAFDYIEILRADEAQTFSNAAVINRMTGDTYDDTVQPGLKKRYWVRAVNRYGQQSPTEPNNSSGVLAGPSSASPTITLIPRGQNVVTGNNIQKVGGSSAWDSDCYSLEAFPNGFILSFRAGQTNLAFMIGVNTDPTTDQNFTSIDYALYCDASGVIEIYESGTQVVANAGSYTTSDVLSIVYDGAVLTYKKNGVVLRTVIDVGKTFFIDSSFFTPNAKAVGVDLIPLNNVDSFVSYTLVPRGNCKYQSGTIQKIGGTTAWDSDCYSLEAYSAGCELRFRPTVTTGAGYMIGFNSDPTTDQNYTSLDHAWFQNYFTNQWDIYESGTGVASGLGAIATSDTPLITYDGITVRYYLNGLLKREKQNPGKTFFLDSSFYSPGVAVTGVYFGPQTSATGSRLVTRGNCVVVGNTVQKQGGSGAWDSDCYSNEVFVGGCQVSWRYLDAGSDDYMIGLNSDPTTDQSYTSLDYTIQMIGSSDLGFIVESSVNQSGSGFAITAGDVFSIRYDGQWVRYYQNTTLLREKFAPGLSLFLDSSFFSAGSIAADVSFGPLSGATPSPFRATGNCKVSDKNIQKVGGSSAWDSQVYSIVGHPNCHVAWKCNQVNLDLGIGLNADPTTDANYTSIDYWIDCTSSGTWQILESGSSSGLPGGTYTTATVFQLTYDGTSLKYIVDGVVVRTVSVSSLTLFMDSSFYGPGAGVNSVDFGPTTTLGVADTSQIAPGAVSDTLVATATSVTITFVEFTPDSFSHNDTILSIAYTPPFDCEIELLGTFYIDYSADGGGGGLYFHDLRYSIQDGTFDNNKRQEYFHKGSATDLASNMPVSVAWHFTGTAGVAVTYKMVAAKWYIGDTVVVRNATLLLIAKKR